MNRSAMNINMNISLYSELLSLVAENEKALIVLRTDVGRHRVR